MRLLPWTGDDGKPCYLSTDDPNSLLSRLADDVEAAPLHSAEEVLTGARAVLADPKAGERAVRFAFTRAVESLGDVLRIACGRAATFPRGAATNPRINPPTRNGFAA
ncbi:hypothetical protein [Streptomyces sp. NRRL S-455]|uniref:hypothetical protein n=1 Tax=Streptomyces sp. NRRL S-455 TaxID=1463908 RepID=UPI000B07A4A8|nr:hypothetical protein [Streptomyces sp. NRRL S-455]